MRNKRTICFLFWTFWDIWFFCVAADTNVSNANMEFPPISQSRLTKWSPQTSEWVSSHLLSSKTLWIIHTHTHTVVLCVCVSVTDNMAAHSTWCWWFVMLYLPVWVMELKDDSGVSEFPLNTVILQQRDGHFILLLVFFVFQRPGSELSRADDVPRDGRFPASTARAAAFVSLWH